MLSKALIFTCIGCAGVVATAVSAVLESKKVCERLDSVIVDPEDMYTEEAEVYEEPIAEKIFHKTVQTVKDFKFTIGIAAATIASIIVSHRISKKALASALLSCGLLARNRDALIDTIRDYTKENSDIEEELRTDAAGASFVPANSWMPVTSVEKTGFGDTLCYFEYSGRWFESSEEAVREQLSEFNRELTHDLASQEYGGYANLNDIYSILGLMSDQLGETLGWAPNYYDEKDGILFDIHTSNKWKDYFGEWHDCKILVISIDTIRGFAPFECYSDC